MLQTLSSLVNAVNYGGNSPAHLCLRATHPIKLLRPLLAHGADLTIRDRDGFSVRGRLQHEWEAAATLDQVWVCSFGNLQLLTLSESLFARLSSCWRRS